MCRPAVSDTRKPDFTPPPGACDAHCHIFGPGDKYPYAPGRSYTPPDAPLERFRALQATLGLERAVLVNASCHGVDNTVILDAIAQSGGQYRGVANVDDSFTDEEFRRLDDGGIRGVVICTLDLPGRIERVDERHVQVGAGVPCTVLARQCAQWVSPWTR